MQNFEKEVELRRVTRVAKELVSIVRRDAFLFKKISRRTLRWIKTQDRLDREALDAKDEAARLVKRRKVALSKLTRRELELLGLNNPDQDEDE